MLEDVKLESREVSPRAVSNAGRSYYLWREKLGYDGRETKTYQSRKIAVG